MLDGTPRTRAELIRMTGLARSTVGARVDALLAAGLLTPSGEAASTGGRPPARLAFNPDAGVVIGVDVGATHALVALTDLRARVLDEAALTLDVTAGPKAVLDQVARTSRALLKSAGRSRADLAQTLSFQILPKVAGVPLEGGPEVFLERVVTAKTVR